MYIKVGVMSSENNFDPAQGLIGQDLTVIDRKPIYNVPSLAPVTISQPDTIYIKVTKR